MSYDLTAIVNGQLQVHTHRGQARAIQSTARHVLVLAGTQSGKTSRFGPFWLYNEIQRCEPSDYLIVAPSFPLLELKLRPEFMHLFDRQLRLGDYSSSPTKFQSTAHPKAGRNAVLAWRGRLKRRFQSTAHPKAGRNVFGLEFVGSGHGVSIHGPPEGRPKHGYAAPAAVWTKVSIHGPPEGRPKPGCRPIADRGW